MKKSLSTILLIVILLSLMPSASVTAMPQGDLTTVTIQPDGTAGKDNYISSAANTNYGTTNILKVGEANNATLIGRSLLSFDLSGLPYDMDVVTATLTLTVDQDLSDNARTMYAYAIYRTWGETSGSGGNWSTGWQIPGATGALDVVAIPIGEVSVANNLSAGSTVSVLLDGNAIEAMRRENYFGIKLQMDVENNDQYIFRSSDYSTPSSRPKLVLEYDALAEVVDPGWRCDDSSYFFSGPPADACASSLPMSPYQETGSDTSVGSLAQAKLLCEPAPRCVNDYPIHYRVEWQFSRIGGGPTSSNTVRPYFVIPFSNGAQNYYVTDPIPCGSSGPTASCSGVLEGTIPTSELPDNYGGQPLTIALGYVVGGNLGGGTHVMTFDLFLSWEAFDQNCADVWAVAEPDTYDIDSNLETPLGVAGEPPDYQMYETEVGQNYMVRVNDGPWNDGTENRTDAAVSLDGDTWMTWADFSASAFCIDVEPETADNPDYRILYFKATVEAFYIRVNDTAGEFADNIDGTYSYTIGVAALSSEGCPEFTYSPEDLYTTVTVPATDDDVSLYDVDLDPVIGGEWYGIKVDSGTWNENSPTTPRIDMEFNFIVEASMETVPAWHDLAEGSPLVSCETTDGEMVFVQAPLGEVRTLHLRVNDQDDPQNFADNSGSLEVSIYHVTNTYTPSGCAADYAIDDLVSTGEVRGDQINGKDFANSLLNGSVSQSYSVVPGGWYMLETTDGPWRLRESFSSVGGDYQPGNDYYDVQLKTEFPSSVSEWEDPEEWSLSACVVPIDPLGHIRVYFQIPNNNAGDLNQGGASYYIRVAGAGLLGTGSIRWNLYQAIDVPTAGEGNNPWESCLDQYVFSSSLPLNEGAWIPTKEESGVTITQYGATGGGASILISGEDYWLETLNGPWYDGENPENKYAAQLSDDGGETWFLISDHPEVYCSEVDPLGSYERAFFHVEVGQIWKIRVADTETEIFTDNEGTLAYTLHAVNPAGFPITTDDITDENFEVCAPILVRPQMASASFVTPGIDIPETPGAWEISDWVTYLGDWFHSLGVFIGSLFDEGVTYIGQSFRNIAGYGGNFLEYINRSFISYFAWCPRHVNILLVAVHKIEHKEPLATVLELKSAGDTATAEVKSYDWGGGGEGGGVGDGYEDTSIFSFGEGGGEGENVNTVNNIIAKIFPIEGAGFDPWDGGDIVAFGPAELPSYYNTCNTVFADFLPSKLRMGVCFATAYWKQTGAAWWVQMSLDISTVFLLIAMIKSSAQSLIYMMTGVRPWTKDGAIKLLDNTVAGDPFKDSELNRTLDGVKRAFEDRYKVR